MIRRPPRSTQSRSSAASDVYKRQEDALHDVGHQVVVGQHDPFWDSSGSPRVLEGRDVLHGVDLHLWHVRGGRLDYFTEIIDARSFFLSLIHISEPTRLGMISYAVF